MILNLIGENKIELEYDQGLNGIRWTTGIHANESDIEITGGPLSITGNKGGNGILAKDGNITIKEATIAMSYNAVYGGVGYSAAIGSKDGETCGNIHIENSDISINVAYKSVPCQAAIGCGRNGGCGNIDIYGKSQEDFLSEKIYHVIARMLF